MIGSQFHPEFKSRPNKPHPLFLAFVQAAEKYQRGQHKDEVQKLRLDTLESTAA